VDETSVFGRVDWQITDDHRFEATYQRLKESSLRTDDFFLGNNPQVTGLNTFYVSGTDSKYYSGRLYSNWTDNFSTELRYAHADIQDLQDPFGGGEAQSGNPIPRIIVGIDNPTGTPDATILAGPGTSRSANDLKTKVDLFKAVANFDSGDHKLKVGAEINKANIFNLFVQNATGTLIFRNLADLQAGLLSPGTGNNSTSTLPGNVVGGVTEGAFGNFSSTGDINDAAAQFKRTIYSMYFQDDWRVNDQLNAVMGVRMDMFDGPGPKLNPNFVERYGFDNTTGFSDIDPVFLPRIGLTYDLNDFGVLRRAKHRHLLRWRSLGVVRQCVPEQRLRLRPGDDPGIRLPGRPDRRRHRRPVHRPSRMLPPGGDRPGGARPRQHAIGRPGHQGPDCLARQPRLPDGRRIR
jgi:hypothetical protein